METQFIKSFFCKFFFKRKKLEYTQIGDYKILINNDHSLPYYLKNLPYYSKNFPRIASNILEKYSDLIIIDIGANIGDTVALTRSEMFCPIICIEGDDYFFNILKKNLEGFKEVEAFKCFLGDESKKIAGEIVSHKGTLKIVEKKSAILNQHIEICTLDNFLISNLQIKKAKLLKIDTDGYDLKIIRGGINYIQETKPILFIEYDTRLLFEANDDGLSTLNLLENLGYYSAIFYDNFGRFILSANLQNKQQIEQLHFYIEKGRGAFQYYDICLFHKDDSDLAEQILQKEIAFFKNN